MSIDDLVYGFHARLKELVERHPEALERLIRFEPAEHRYDDAVMLGRRAADLLVAPVLWSEAVGSVYDTAKVAELLDVTRQAIAQRVASGAILALPGQRSRMYPTWQFEWGAPCTVNPLVQQVMRTWVQIEPTIDPMTVAAWANSPSEYLDGRRPSEAIEKHDEAVVWAAQAAAHQRTR
jgi:hypothetical protein